MNNYVYIVQCADATYYTGWTNDLKKRIEAHNAGKGAKYTKSRQPVQLVYYETYATKSEAMAREYAIKQLSRQEKAQLIKAGSLRSKTVPNNKEHDSQ
ncbi:MAG: GIY-YIG nuclease family protein [Absicoccus porci]|uniref:GIY-YIG nuclease family protein n=1 Tax=Absicoccus porci TaxID=2486576 RepID=UPI0024091035|nr:GIY-YIG nuclease family protein [Absicoccus porci]MDD6460254.1 GIY-YIG nuclease family protein [Absicoccus porci]